MLRRVQLAPRAAVRTSSSSLWSPLGASCCVKAATSLRCASSSSPSPSLAKLFTESSQRAITTAKAQRFSQLSAELDTLQARQAELDARADKKPNALAVLTLGYLAAQTAILNYWVYSRFDWCLCEPITYLLGTAVVWLAAGFYLLSGGEYEWDVLRKMVVDKERAKLYAAEGLDAARIEQLMQELEMLQLELGDIPPQTASSAGETTTAK